MAASVAQTAQEFGSKPALASEDHIFFINEPGKATGRYVRFVPILDMPSLVGIVEATDPKGLYDAKNFLNIINTSQISSLSRDKLRDEFLFSAYPNSVISFYSADPSIRSTQGDADIRSAAAKRIAETFPSELTAKNMKQAIRNDDPDKTPRFIQVENANLDGSIKAVVESTSRAGLFTRFANRILMAANAVDKFIDNTYTAIREAPTRVTLAAIVATENMTARVLARIHATTESLETRLAEIHAHQAQINGPGHKKTTRRTLFENLADIDPVSALMTKDREKQTTISPTGKIRVEPSFASAPTPASIAADSIRPSPLSVSSKPFQKFLAQKGDIPLQFYAAELIIYAHRNSMATQSAEIRPNGSTVAYQTKNYVDVLQIIHDAPSLNDHERAEMTRDLARLVETTSGPEHAKEIKRQFEIANSVQHPGLDKAVINTQRAAVMSQSLQEGIDGKTDFTSHQILRETVKLEMLRDRILREGPPLATTSGNGIPDFNVDPKRHEEIAVFQYQTNNRDEYARVIHNHVDNTTTMMTAPTLLELFTNPTVKPFPEHVSKEAVILNPSAIIPTAQDITDQVHALKAEVRGNPITAIYEKILQRHNDRTAEKASNVVQIPTRPDNTNNGR